MCSADPSAERARAVIPSGCPGPSPTARSRPGSASKSSTVAPTFSDVSSSSVDVAPQEELLLDDADADASVDPPHCDVESDAVVDSAPARVCDAPHVDSVATSAGSTCGVGF